MSQIPFQLGFPSGFGEGEDEDEDEDEDREHAHDQDRSDRDRHRDNDGRTSRMSRDSRFPPSEAGEDDEDDILADSRSLDASCECPQSF